MQELSHGSPRSEDSDADSADRLAFQLCQLERLSAQMPLVLLADVVAGGFLFAVIYNFQPSLAGLGWITVLLIVTSVRAFLIIRERDQPLDTDRLAGRWRLLVGGALLSGIIWGNAWLLLPQDADFNQVLLIGFWLAGMQAGAVSSLTIVMPVFLAFAIPSTGFFVGFTLLTLEENRVLLASVYLMYLAFLIPIVFRTGKDFAKGIRLQIDNAALKERLEREAAVLERKEQELALQVARGVTLQSEKEVANERLRVASDEKALLLGALKEGVFGLDEAGRIIFTNASALRVLNAGESELLGLPVVRLLDPPENDLDEDPAEAIARCFHSGEPVLELEADLRAGESRRLPVRFSCIPLHKGETITGAVLSFMDVSRHKEMEAMLLQSQKMEAIGRLTGGVAHDFNNLLTVILGNLQFLKKRVEGDERAQILIDKIAKAASSGGDLNNRLLSFSREQALERELIVVSELLEEMKEFLTRLLGETIRLSLDVTDRESAVLTDRTQLQNAILNICVNARDAMLQGGELLITTTTVRRPRQQITGEDSAEEADYVEISLTDNGSGIPAEIQKQIFEPFFTTKEKERGTGLGLSTVYGFIRQSGGNITVHSREGEWTRFRIFLPLADTVTVPGSRTLPESTPGEELTGTILVVEDDPNVRDVAIYSLEECGFNVVSAGDAAGGLSQLEEHPEIGLVFSDIIMPGGMNGIDMAEAILEQHPGMPIILATGYTDKRLKDRLRDVPNVLFISKPYDTEALPELIRSLPLRRAS